MAEPQLLPPWMLDTMPAQGGAPTHDDRVLDALESLTLRQQQVLNGIFYERLSERQLARELGLARTTVATHKHRALLKLREMLGDDR